MKVLRTPEQNKQDKDMASSLPVAVVAECRRIYYWGSTTESACGATLKVEESDIRWVEYDNGPYCNGDRDAGTVYYAHCAYCGTPIILSDSGGHNINPLIMRWVEEKIKLKPMSDYPGRIEVLKAT